MAATPTLPAVGIVGAGLAGLTAAYTLSKKNIPTVIFEASSRTGGRAYTQAFPNGQIYEVGGEMIDTDHTQIISLVNEVGLQIVTAVPNPALQPKYMVDGQVYPNDAVFADYQVVFPRIQSDAKACWPGPKFKPNSANQILDRVNLENYINDVCTPLGGADSRFAKLLKNAYTIEYGLEPVKQSCLNLLFLMGFGTISTFSMFGPSDEVYNIRGGTQRLADRLVEILMLSGLCNIRLNTPVTKVARVAADGSYTLTANSVAYNYPQIIMTIPFPMYASVDISEAQFSGLKRYIINNGALGSNSKLNVQFTTPFWQSLGCTGETYAPSYQNTWDVAADQAGTTGVLVNYTGGGYAETFPTSFMSSSPVQRNKDLKAVTDRFLTQLNGTFPGASSNFTYVTTSDIQNVASVNWRQMPWNRGAYSVYVTGQYSGGLGTANPDGTASPPGSIVPFAGNEALPEPQDLQSKYQTCHFAGEACTIDYQGFLNGAVVTGQNAAAEVIALYKTNGIMLFKVDNLDINLKFNPDTRKVKEIEYNYGDKVIHCDRPHITCMLKDNYTKVNFEDLMEYAAVKYFLTYLVAGKFSSQFLGPECEACIMESTSYPELTTYLRHIKFSGFNRLFR